jgi:hypothetical protein
VIIVILDHWRPHMRLFRTRIDKVEYVGR